MPNEAEIARTPGVRDRGGENEGSAVDALVAHDDTGTREESARRIQAIG